MLGRSAKRKNGQPLRLQRGTAFLTLAVFLFAATAFFGHAQAAHAAAVNVGLGFGTALGLATGDIRTYVGAIIRYFLMLLGLIAVLLVMYAGFLWMTAQGNEEKVSQAKKILVNAVIGLIIIVSAYGIVSFILQSLGLGTSGGGVSSSGSGAPAALSFSNRGADQLGNGIIEYHYPEPGQTDVPRNTKISITFKKPIALSSIFKNYDDKGTYDPSDDLICSSGNTCAVGAAVTPATQLLLNTDNIKIIANGALAAAGSGTIDQQFTNRYPTGAAVDATARFTAVVVPLSAAGQEQTIVLKPIAPIGSATENVNYRVALRGGDNGVKAWTLPATGVAPTAGAAFARAFADGGYYWSFTTSTVIDTTPPHIVAIVPSSTYPVGTPASSVLERNQLLQIYFSKPIDATSATGIIGAGAGAGFTNVMVTAICNTTWMDPLKGGNTDPAKCVFNNGNSGSVDGTMAIGNRSQTLEFTPSTLCENVPLNSCGEQVFCLPKNVKLSVRAMAASIGSTGPTAIASDGIVDMADNSLDGNGDGTAQGRPSSVQTVNPERTIDFYRNNPQTGADLAVTDDNATWDYSVGSNVDLIAPFITQMDPTPLTGGTPQKYPLGPSEVPAQLIPTITWSKTMSVAAIRTGSFDEAANTYAPSSSTISLRSHECLKTGTAVCKPNSPCPCTPVEPPGYFIDSGAPLPNPDGTFYTKMSFLHPVRPFYTANDLGYTDADVLAGASIPMYVPIARAQLRDTRQNCFYPSKFTSCSTNASNGQTSCCNSQVTPDGTFLTTCTPN